jgi:hypothetical protein
MCLYRFGRKLTGRQVNLHVHCGAARDTWSHGGCQGVIDRQQQSGLLVPNEVDTQSLLRTITKNHIASSHSGE